MLRIRLKNRGKYSEEREDKRNGEKAVFETSIEQE